MNKRLFSAFLSACCLASVSAVMPDAEIDSRVSDLLGRMTLDEKIGQLNQLSGYGYAPDMVGRIRGGAVGSLLNETDPEVVNQLQREAVENSRLGIPLIFARDVIHGFKTIFPIPLGQAASWNPDIVREGARIAADEASSVGIRWTFSPMVDISRDARWGRIAESFGEDPVLSAKLGVAMVEGYQGDDLARPNTMAACAKHFAGYGASESGKDYNTTWIPETLLRDVYLRPFKELVKAGSATFMCSFNDINGVPSSGNRVLLEDILRGEWGYDGMMVSDWGSIEQMIPHGYSADLRQAASQAVNAGVDMDMESHAYTSHLRQLVESGEVSEARVDSLVRNVLTLKYRLGLFENPYVDVASSRRFYAPSSLDAARRAVEESAILLKNTGTLPLNNSKVKKIAVIGPMADAQHDQAGTWVFDLEKERSVTPLTALQQMYGKENVIYAPGLEHTRDLDTKGFANAVKAARKADVVLFFAGEEAVLSGEAHCRADLSLPGAQSRLLAELKSAGKPVVMIVQAGRQLAIMPESEMADAVVYCFHGGTMTGPALANLLSGKANFSGRCPVSFPRMSGQEPLYYNHKNTGRPASGITLINDIELEAGQTSTGCTSYFLDAGDGAFYPFGYGLSYTTFEYGEPVLSATSIAPDGSLKVSCTVTNTGNREGAEVAQLYIRDHVASLVRPVRELRDFAKITLKPGESRTLEFTITPADLEFHVNGAQTVVEPGEFSVWVAPNAGEGTPAKFTVVKPNDSAAK